MERHKTDMYHFRKEIQKIVKRYEYQPISYDTLNNFPLNGKQCIYVAHWQAEGIVFEKGLENLTGYSLNEFNTEDLIHYVHPDERELVMNITKEVVKHVITVDLRSRPAHLFLSFRFRKKDGRYIKLLRQSSSFELDNEGKLVSNFSLLTDISFIDSSKRVEWDFQASDLDLEAFRNILYGVYRDFFSPREKEIIPLIADGLTTLAIAKKLYISKHTVATHRKKILKKSGAHNATDLIEFCKKNGIL